MNLLDTNVVSELRKSRPEPRVQRFLEVTEPDSVLSVVSIAEIRVGIQKLDDPYRRGLLEQWLEKDIRERFKGRIIPVTEEILIRWRHMADVARKAGRPYGEPDLLLAATAIELGCDLVTRNVRDFAGLPLQVINPWELF